jgi:threonine/homoserine/homoserine lactone efflux protein
MRRMTQETLLALIAFAFVTSVTPGPNNLMLMASGANFGLYRTAPHMAGVALGFVFLAMVIGAGLGQVFEALPWTERALKAVSIVYMLWLAWKIARAAAPGAGSTEGQPLTFLQAAAFQWVNPKAWAMALTAVTVYAPTGGLAAVALVAAVFGIVNLPSVGIWVLMGLQIRRFLADPRRLALFNGTMAVLLMGSLWPILRM